MGFAGAPARLPSLSSREQQGSNELAKSEYAQDVQSSIRGPARRNEASPQIDLAVVMEMFTIFSNRLDNMKAMLGKQSTVNNPSVAPPTSNASSSST